ncbi:MAG: restriction endonuclease [Methylococcaceae bacterium]
MISVELLKPLVIVMVGLLSASVFLLWLKARKNKKSEPAKTRKNSKWSMELLMSLEWKRYEEICKAFLTMTEKGRFNVDVTNTGADGGIDLKLTNKKDKLVGVGQCKAWSGMVGVAPIRELYGVMASEQIKIGYFFTTSSFSADAIQFAKDKITLITGREQIKTIESLTSEQQNDLYRIATAGDYTTPTCPNCDKKMIRRQSNEKAFWGCSNYPRCKNILQIRKS